MSAEKDPRVEGERGAAWSGSLAAPHTRVSNRLALLSASAFGVMILGSYYWRIAHGQVAPHQHTQGPGSQPAEPDLPMPDFSLPRRPDTTAIQESISPEPAIPEREDRAMAPALQPPGAPQADAHPVADRRLSGHVYAPADGAPGATSPPAEVAPDSAMARGSPARPADAVTTVARYLPDQRLMLPKGAFIDCTLETAIDSTLPGMTTCITATDTFGADGKVVLLERGSKISGETRGQVQQGRARIFVVWTEARTPSGVIVPLESPAADDLGRAGLEGAIDRHFWQRFGAALLISTIDSGTQAAVQSIGRGGPAVVYGPSGAEQVATEALKGTLDIPPTIRKDNGDRVQVLVARDIDFRTVYELRHVRSNP